MVKLPLVIHRLLPLILGAGAVWGAVASFTGVGDALRTDAAQEASMQSRIESPHSPDGVLLSWTSASEDALVRSVAAAESLASQRNTMRAVSWLREKARLTENATERVELFCHSLGLYGNALEREPYNSDLLLGWASVRQLLGVSPCNEPHTSGKFEAAVEEAVRWNPYDHDVVFGSALLELWSGNRERAGTLFQRLITYSTQMGSNEESVILSELRSAKDVQAIIPPYLPQVVRWSRLIRERRPGDFLSWHTVLGSLQRTALVDGQARVRSRTFPQDLYAKEVLQLLGFAAEDSVRQQLDQELSLLSRQHGDGDAAEFFSARAVMHRLLIVPSSVAGDTRMIAPLVRWGGNEVVYIDDFSQSVGFFLAAQQGVSLIVLRSLSGRSNLEPGGLRVFVSDDNEHWTELPPKQIKSVRVAGESLFAISVPTEAHRYWKVHGSSSQKERSFGAPLQDLLTVFGNSARKREDR